VATRTAVVQLVVGDKTARVAAAFLDHLKKALRRHGITLSGVLSDTGPIFTGKAFKTCAAGPGAGPSADPARSPNHDAICERFHGTVLNEFYRPTSTGVGSTTSRCSTGRCRPGWSTKTSTAPTTATTWPAGPHCRSRRNCALGFGRLPA